MAWEPPVTDTSVRADGRVARREKNVNAVLDVVLEMFAEDSMFPSIEQAATRSGLSLRSVYRYFADPGELLEAAIKRSRELGAYFMRIPSIGEGELEDRIDEFVAARLQFHESAGPMYRATLANAARLPQIGDELRATRDELRHQFEVQFAPELAPLSHTRRDAAVCAGDVLTQLDSVDFLRRHRQLSASEAGEVLRAALAAILTTAS